MIENAKIGDVVYAADFDSKQEWVQCPCCLGQKYLTVITGDGTQHTVDCDGCARGYEGSLGSVQIYDRKPSTRLCIIGGITITGDKEPDYQVNKNTNSWNTYGASNLYPTREEAMAAAVKRIAELREADEKKIGEKAKPNKTWRSNVLYHRERIKSAQRDLDYHNRCLNAAQKHLKEEKAS